MRYPPPPHRPQAYRVRRARRRAGEPAHGRTWYFCVAALALLAFVATIATSRSAIAAPDRPRPVARAVGGDAQPGASAPLTAAAPARALPVPDEASAAAARALSSLDKPDYNDAPQAAPWSLDAPGPAAPADTLAPRLTNPAAVQGRLGASRQGRQLRAQVTAYSASIEEGTAWGITRSGTRARPGVVAVDPRIIPLGSRVRIAGLPGIYRAEDTGGGILGAHLDVFMESRAEALRFGRQTGILVELLD